MRKLIDTAHCACEQAEDDKPHPVRKRGVRPLHRLKVKQINMSRAGRELEQLIATIEQLLGGTNVQVKSPDYIVGVISGVRREIDVSLRARVGSSEILVILECRDRTETEDVTWIEQLASKREDVLASKVVAVSSSGFSEGATIAAKRRGVELRSVHTLTFQDVASWFNFKVYSRRAVLNNVHLGVRDASVLQAVNERLAKASPLDAKTFTLIRTITGVAESLASIWEEVRKANDSIFDDMDDGDVKQVAIPVRYDDPSDRYQLHTDKGLIPIEQMTFQAELSVRQISPSRITQYAEATGSPIAQSVHFVIDDEAGRIEITVHSVRNGSSSSS